MILTFYLHDLDPNVLSLIFFMAIYYRSSNRLQNQSGHKYRERTKKKPKSILLYLNEYWSHLKFFLGEILDIFETHNPIFKINMYLSTPKKRPKNSR